MTEPLSILVLSGSPRQTSYTRSLSRLIIAGLGDRGQAVTALDLHETVLPPMNLELRRKGAEHPDAGVAGLFRAAAAADAFVLATPIYHNSFSGVLKNALDYLGHEYFEKKAVGLASHGGDGSHQAVDQLRVVTQHLRAIPMTLQVCTGTRHFAEDPDQSGLYALTDADMQEHIGHFCDELVSFGRALRAYRAATLAK